MFQFWVSQFQYFSIRDFSQHRYVALKSESAFRRVERCLWWLRGEERRTLLRRVRAGACVCPKGLVEGAWRGAGAGLAGEGAHVAGARAAQNQRASFPPTVDRRKQETFRTWVSPHADAAAASNFRTPDAVAATPPKEHLHNWTQEVKKVNKYF